MPSPHRPARTPPDHGRLDALLTQAHRLRGGIDAVRPDAVDDTDGQPGAAERRWRRALCDLAAHQLDALSTQLGQLREGPPDHRPPHGHGPRTTANTPATGDDPAPAPPAGRVGSAEWNLRTGDVTWSPETYRLLGRQPSQGPLTLDDLPSRPLPVDQPALAAALTDCLVDGRPLDLRFRVPHHDGTVRTLHMLGEPVRDPDGRTAAVWAVLRDVSGVERHRRAVAASRAAWERERHVAQTERRLAVELQEAVLPPWRDTVRLPGTGPGSLDLAAYYLPSSHTALVGGQWYDALPLPDGGALLTTGDLTGHGAAATFGMAMLLGAVRGMAVAGTAPGRLLRHLNDLLDAASQPALGSALCCRYAPEAGTLTWAQAGHPAPLLYRRRSGRVLPAPEGVLLGVTSGAVYGQRTERLRPGDVLLLRTEGLLPMGGQATGEARLLRLAPRLSEARTAWECVRVLVEEFGGHPREDDACVLVARVLG